LATDAGIPAQVGDALIEITILDANDNSPEFDQQFYTISVVENITLPSIIGRVHATDIDIGDNGQLLSIIFDYHPIFQVVFDIVLLVVH